MTSVPPPALLSWNLTRACNLRCPHCYIDATVRQHGDGEELDTERCLATIDELAALAPGCLLILTGGEPMLRRDIGDLVAHAARAGLHPVLGTNGILLDGDALDRLKGAGLAGLSVSIDSVDPERHDRFRGRRGAHRLTVGTVRLARARDLPVVIQHSLLPFNVGELPKMAELAHELGASVLNVFYLVCTGRGEKVTALSARVYEESLGRLADLRQEWAGRLTVGARCAPQFARVLTQRGADAGALAEGCPAGRTYLRIAPDGEVTPCPYMPEAAGRLTDRTLAAIWEQAPVMQAMRDRVLPGRCGACEYTASCGGCRARALAETGDVAADDPFCPHRPAAGGSPRLPVVEAPGRASPAAPAALVWEDEARRFLERIPPFVRGRIVRRVEAACVERGLSEVTVGLLKELRPAGAARRPGITLRRGSS